MDASLIELSPATLILVPIVLGLVQIFKPLIQIRFVPILALSLGVAGSFLLAAATWQITVLTGIVIGLMASGAYASVKTTLTPTE